MENTFTYTARSALAPEKVVTFTLYDKEVSVDLGAPLEHVQRGIEGEQKEAESEAEEQAGTVSYYALKPTVISLLEKGTRPFHVGDVYAMAKGDGLTVTAWVRAKGLRLAPIQFAWDEVDNPGGAEAFADQLRARRQAVSHPGRFSGVMDYWISWLLFGVLLLVLFLPRGEADGQETE
jgi:hypothetical protein